MKTVHKLLNIIIVLTLLAVATSFVMKKQLPPPEMLDSRLHQMPRQENRNYPPFTIDYRGAGYQISPVADYELWGLVVSHNDIGKFGDIYHTEDSVDLRDACVVWGGNAESGVYQKGKYKNGSWTCYWRFSSGDAWRQFKEYEIANNHLLASDPDIQNKIRGIRAGDQLHLKGYLVDYENLETGWKRETSMTRRDTGNGACEVFFVEEFNLLKPGNAEWYLVWQWGKWVILGLIVLKLLLIYAEAQKDVDKSNKQPE